MSTTVRNIEQLQKSLLSVRFYKTTIYVEVNGFVKEAQVVSNENCTNVQSHLFESPGCVMSKQTDHDTVAEAFLHLAQLLPGATVFPQSFTLDSEQPDLNEITRAAWCEALSWQNNQERPAGDRDTEREMIMKNNLWSKLTGGDSGIKLWNQVPADSCRLVHWCGSNLADAQLQGVILATLDFAKSSFDRAHMDNAMLGGANLHNATFCDAQLPKAHLVRAIADEANFTRANLKHAILTSTKLRKAILKDADLTKADLQRADLRGVDLTSVCLNETKLDRAEYDDTTEIPRNFPQWSTLRWVGNGPDPFKEAFRLKLQNLSVANFDEFVDYLRTAPLAVNRIANALKMLKKERFDLFSEIHSKSISGVVKSQTDPELIYACALADDGSFSCCTQNLRPCGGLKGAVCKHILVLTIGLAHANKIDLTAVARWLLKSTHHQPILQKPAMIAVFLRFKRALTGEIDWRPTETIPEDYYAF